MGYDRERAREIHQARMQKTLEDGLKAIRKARTIQEADSVRTRTKLRLEELHRIFNDAFPEEAAGDPRES